MTDRRLIQYWHPSRGGWHVGEEIERKPSGIVVRELGRRIQFVVPETDVKQLGEGGSDGKQTH